MTGLELRSLRKKIDMSRENFAGLIGISIHTLDSWEGGKRNIPDTKAELIKLKTTDIVPINLKGINGKLYTRNSEGDYVNINDPKDIIVNKEKNGPEYVNILDQNISVNDSKEVFTTKSGNVIDELPNGKFLLTVPLLPHKAHATYISHFQDADYVSEFTRVSFIVDKVPRGKYLAFEIQNDSMNDATMEREASRSAILNGDIVLGRELGKQHWKSKLNTNAYPHWIIVHKDTIVCKEIINHDVENGIITCHSLNSSPEFQDFDLKLNECLQLFNIVKKQI